MMVSMVKRCYETDTHPISFDEIWDVIRTGKHGLKEKITQIRNRYEMELAVTGDPEKAKKAIADLKADLPCFMPSGTFSTRSNEGLVEHSGILCADLDTLGDKLPFIRDALKSYPFVRAIALSPSGDGLKVFFDIDPTRHLDSFRAIQDFMRNEAGIEIDPACKDPARLVFFTWDENLWIREEENEIIPPAATLPRVLPPPTMVDVNLAIRQQCAIEVAGQYGRTIEWISGSEGFLKPCPNFEAHGNKNGPKDCKVFLLPSEHFNGATFYCVHQSCRSIILQMRHELCSKIARAELKESRVSHPPYRDVRCETVSPNGSQTTEINLDKPLITFYSPKQLKSYVPPPDIQLIGDYHIVKDTGFVAVIGGPAGVGKSLTSIALAVAGANGEGDWFGLKIHRKFKTMIIQTENGPFRLARNFQELDCDMMEEFVRVCDPPPMGLAFRREEFYLLVKNEIAGFAPDIVVLDPFNSVARDQEQRTYLETIDLVRSVLPMDTALVIVAHTRKPQPNERAVGRSLMNILAGSHVLVTIPRSVFVLQYASDDPEDSEVVWTCCKNNDGELGKRSAWKRKTGLFLPVPNFDWSTFDGEDKDKRVVITAEMVEEVFEDGLKIRSLARDRLMEISGASKAACYKALSTTGRFADNLIFKGDIINYLRK